MKRGFMNEIWYPRNPLTTWTFMVWLTPKSLFGINNNYVNYVSLFSQTSNCNHCQNNDVFKWTLLVSFIPMPYHSSCLHISGTPVSHHYQHSTSLEPPNPHSLPKNAHQTNTNTTTPSPSSTFLTFPLQLDAENIESSKVSTGNMLLDLPLAFPTSPVAEKINLSFTRNGCSYLFWFRVCMDGQVNKTKFHLVSWYVEVVILDKLKRKGCVMTWSYP